LTYRLRGRPRSVASDGHRLRQPDHGMSCLVRQALALLSLVLIWWLGSRAHRPQKLFIEMIAKAHLASHALQRLKHPRQLPSIPQIKNKYGHPMVPGSHELDSARHLGPRQRHRRGH
jgi:hypothetical protein